MADHICHKTHELEIPKAIIDLPSSQRKWWRHVCAGCAYELGRKEAEEQVKSLLDQVHDLKYELALFQANR